jgi:AcrR family transcriptional regulator
MASGMPETVLQPQQKRSRKTLERLLQAAEVVLGKGPVEEATVSEIVRRSGTSVGAFYGRFADKESLLDCLGDTFFQRARQYWEDFFASPDWRQGHLDERLHRLVQLLVTQNRAHRALLRALQLYAWSKPSSSFNRRRKKLEDEVIDEVRKSILARPREWSHPQPALAARIGIRMLLTAIQGLVLLDEKPLNNEVLTDELTRALLTYLGMRCFKKPSKRASG